MSWRLETGWSVKQGIHCFVFFFFPSEIRTWIVKKLGTCLLQHANIADSWFPSSFSCANFDYTANCASVTNLSMHSHRRNNKNIDVSRLELLKSRYIVIIIFVICSLWINPSVYLNYMLVVRHWLWPESLSRVQRWRFIFIIIIVKQ